VGLETKNTYRILKAFVFHVIAHTRRGHVNTWRRNNRLYGEINSWCSSQQTYIVHTVAQGHDCVIWFREQKLRDAIESETTTWKNVFGVRLSLISL